MIYLVRILVSIFYIFIVYWNINVLGGLEGFNDQIITFLWIHIALKMLFIKLQDRSGWWHFSRFAIEAVAVYFFAPDIYGIGLLCLILFPAGFAWSNLTLMSSLATGHGPVEVHNALNNAVSRSNNNYD